jgi:hypothetical protein
MTKKQLLEWFQCSKVECWSDFPAIILCILVDFGTFWSFTVATGFWDLTSTKSRKTPLEMTKFYRKFVMLFDFHQKIILFACYLSSLICFQSCFYNCFPQICLSSRENIDWPSIKGHIIAANGQYFWPWLVPK